jgi:pimeloyl-ACP methyl ester carboxylesterase
VDRVSARRNARIVAGGVATGVVGALVAGVLTERRVVRTRRAAAAGAGRLGSLRGTSYRVTTSDGITLHAEVDEPAPYEVPGKRARPAPEPEVTIVFVHGYCLNLDCWHYQREALRGKHRLVFYDQRSHGRSDRSDREHATIDQLGRDLKAVLEQLVPTGPVVLVGHSMGGMTIMAFADDESGLFADRVAGVALIATTAGHLRPHRIVSRLIPNRLGEVVAPRLVAALANAPELVDSARRGSNIGFLAAELFAFGDDAPPEQVEFLDEMLGSTPFGVIAEFYPNFSALDRFTALERIAAKPIVIVCGTEDKLTSIGHSRKMARLMPSARLVECPGSGHMVLFEAADDVNAAIAELIGESLS